MDIHIQHSIPSTVILPLYSFIYKNDIPIDIEFIEPSTITTVQESPIITTPNNTVSGPYSFFEQTMDSFLGKSNSEKQHQESNQSIFSFLFSNKNVQSNVQQTQKQDIQNNTVHPELNIPNNVETITDIRIIPTNPNDLDILSSLAHTKLYYLLQRKNKPTLWI
jgi:hypothetical protein